jgi:membrane fusion protein, multidrug efflux system
MKNPTPTGAEAHSNGLSQHHQQQTARLRWVWLMALLLPIGGVAGGAWWWSVQRNKTDAAAQAGPDNAQGKNMQGKTPARRGGGNATQPVSTQAVRRQDIDVSVSAMGSISASNTATVRAQVSGVLQRLDFKEGQQIKAGQLLAQIDPRSFQAAARQAQGTLARDKAQLAGARVDLLRYQKLLAENAIAKQQFDTQVALVEQLKGTIQADQAMLENAQLQLSHTQVRAPISGRLGLKQADLGNVVQPSDANGIVTISQTQPVALLFSVPAVHVPFITSQLRQNEAITVQVLGADGAAPVASGQLAAVDNAIDPSTDTIKVKAWFANADDALFPSQAVSVRLQLKTLKQVLTVPQAAVLRGAQGFYVYVLGEDNSVSTRVVQPGPVQAGTMAVSGVLQVGEKVVVDGTDRLREGAKVRVIDKQPSPGADAAASSPAGSRPRQRGAPEIKNN